MSHHPSCRDSDKTLGYSCHQCGEFEPREDLLDLLEKAREEIRLLKLQSCHKCTEDK